MFVSRTEEHLGQDQFVGQRLKMTKGISARGEFHGTARADRNLHWIPPVMVLREHLEGQAHLAEIADAPNLGGPDFGAGDGRQIKRGQDANDRDDDEQLDQGKRADSRVKKSSIHISADLPGGIISTINVALSMPTLAWPPMCHPAG